VAVPVTIETWDWYYSSRYQDALRQGDVERARLLGEAYVGHVRESILEAEWYADELLGRQPPQILLLHGNLINADRIEDVLGLFRERGYRFITLEEALADEVYARTDASVAPRGLSHWQRLLRTERGYGVCP